GLRLPVRIDERRPLRRPATIRRMAGGAAALEEPGATGGGLRTIGERIDPRALLRRRCPARIAIANLGARQERGNDQPERNRSNRPSHGAAMVRRHHRPRKGSSYAQPTRTRYRSLASVRPKPEEAFSVIRAVGCQAITGAR